MNKNLYRLFAGGIFIDKLFDKHKNIALTAHNVVVYREG